nr:CopG family transcriptional regulator [uncultured Roseateles sp.]
MSTTTIRIEEELKARIGFAAERAGKTAHAFILDAIAQTVEQAEREADFHQAADQRWEEILAGGKTLSWDDTRAYLEARAAGQTAQRPRSSKR